MPQPRSQSGASRSTAEKRSAAAKRGAATRSRDAAKRSAAAKRGAATKRREAAKRSAAAKRGAATRTGSTDDALRANLQAFREAFASSVASLNLLMVSRDRVQEVLDEAVSRGRVTREDANELVNTLVRRGRKQTEDLMQDFEQLLGRGREATTDVRRTARTATVRARRQPVLDRALREVDRTRRAAGMPPTFPILAYDDLTAAQVADRLADLSSAELRKVRDYERRNANRKSVLSAIERALER
jgi:polyhydroxyalkanoate synthesis regulator phasin